jgi:hypothetical protein
MPQPRRVLRLNRLKRSEAWSPVTKLLTAAEQLAGVNPSCTGNLGATTPGSSAAAGCTPIHRLADVARIAVGPAKGASMSSK